MHIASRVLAAVLGGYGLASAWAVLCGAAPFARLEAVLAGMQTSFVVHVAAVVWAFSPVSLRRAWGGLLLVTAAMLAAAWLLHGRA
ncbi:MAG: hypothetical protein ACN6O3_10860 [Comamonas sp.]